MNRISLKFKDNIEQPTWGCKNYLKEMFSNVLESFPYCTKEDVLYEMENRLSEGLSAVKICAVHEDSIIGYEEIIEYFKKNCYVESGNRYN